MSYNTSITEKIKLYKNSYVKGECRSKEYEARVKQEKRLHIKLDLADTIFNDIPFNFTKTQKEHVKDLIRLFPNFKELHSRASNEEIILSFIFYVKALSDKKHRLNAPKSQELIMKYVDDKKVKLFPTVSEIVFWKITLHYISHSYIKPRQPENIDHNILYKGTYKQ